MMHTMEERSMQRTKYCGEVRTTDIGSRMTLTGWVFRRRDHVE
jgi:aspartyl-tRNA synthetase